MKKDVVRFTLRIVPELNEKLEVIGKEKGMTKNNVIPIIAIKRIFFTLTSP